MELDLSNYGTKSDQDQKIKDAKIKDIEDKVPSITKLLITAALNAKTNGVKNEIISITSLATTAVHTTVENKIPKVSGIKNKYLTTSDYNKFHE